MPGISAGFTTTPGRACRVRSWSPCATSTGLAQTPSPSSFARAEDLLRYGRHARRGTPRLHRHHHAAAHPCGADERWPPSAAFTCSVKRRSRPASRCGRDRRVGRARRHPVHGARQLSLSALAPRVPAAARRGTQSAACIRSRAAREWATAGSRMPTWRGSRTSARCLNC